MIESFELELRTYNRNKFLLEAHNGKFVLLRAKSIFGLYESQKDAEAAGCEQFPDELFLVKQIDFR